MKFYFIMWREEFSLFYRAGSTAIPISDVIWDTGNISSTILQKLSMRTPFEYDEDIVVLKSFADQEIFEQYYKLNIEDILEVYPLSEEAKQRMEYKLDRRIELSDPILNSDELEILHQYFDFLSSVRAIIQTKSLFMKDKKFENYDIFPQEIFHKAFENRKNSIKYSQLPKYDFIEILLTYERDEMIPNRMLGYFLDSVIIFITNQKGYEKDSYNKAAVSKSLMTAGFENASFVELVKYLEASEDTKKYVEMTTENHNKLYIIAPLFLALKDLIRNDTNNISAITQLINDVKQVDENAVYYVLVLLTYFFKHIPFYDMYYETKPLPIHKKEKIALQPKKTDDNLAEPEPKSENSAQHQAHKTKDYKLENQQLDFVNEDANTYHKAPSSDENKSFYVLRYLDKDKDKAKTKLLRESKIKEDELMSLVEDGFISEEKKRNATYYKLTPKGEEKLKRQKS